MKTFLNALCFTMLYLFAAQAQATGLATCDSGPEENWRSKEELEKRVTEKGWTVHRIKVDGGCYEVYALDKNGNRLEAYFDPLTLEPVPPKFDEEEKDTEQ